MAGVSALAGEPRFRQLYVDRDQPARVAQRWRDRLGAARLGPDPRRGDRRRLVRAGRRSTLRERYGHVLVAMRADWAVMTRQLPRELTLVGMHGSLTPAEMLVPLLRATEFLSHRWTPVRLQGAAAEEQVRPERPRSAESRWRPGSPAAASSGQQVVGHPRLAAGADGAQVHQQLGQPVRRRRRRRCRRSASRRSARRAPRPERRARSPRAGTAAAARRLSNTGVRRPGSAHPAVASSTRSCHLVSARRSPRASSRAGSKMSMPTTRGLGVRPGQGDGQPADPVPTSRIRAGPASWSARPGHPRRGGPDRPRHAHRHPADALQQPSVDLVPGRRRGRGCAAVPRPGRGTSGPGQATGPAVAGSTVGSPEQLRARSPAARRAPRGSTVQPFGLDPDQRAECGQRVGRRAEPGGDAETLTATEFSLRSVGA